MTPTTRARIWAITGGYCWYCGADLAEGAMTIDHVVPKSAGGRSTRGNLVPSCATCNQEKGTLSLEAFRRTRDRKTFSGEERRARRRVRTA